MGVEEKTMDDGHGQKPFLVITHIAKSDTVADWNRNVQLEENAGDQTIKEQNIITWCNNHSNPSIIKKEFENPNVQILMFDMLPQTALLKRKQNAAQEKEAVDKIKKTISDMEAAQ